MSRLVVVSNRIAPPDDKKASAGGLAVGIMGALKAAGGLWFGWSGEIGDDQQPLKKVKQGNITWASFNLSEQITTNITTAFPMPFYGPPSTIVSIWLIFSVKPGKAISASTQRWRINCCR